MFFLIYVYSVGERMNVQQIQQIIIHRFYSIVYASEHRAVRMYVGVYLLLIVANGG